MAALELFLLMNGWGPDNCPLRDMRGEDLFQRVRVHGEARKRKQPWRATASSSAPRGQLDSSDIPSLDRLRMKEGKGHALHADLAVDMYAMYRGTEYERLDASNAGRLVGGVVLRGGKGGGKDGGLQG